MIFPLAPTTNLPPFALLKQLDQMLHKTIYFFNYLTKKVLKTELNNSIS